MIFKIQKTLIMAALLAAALACFFRLSHAVERTPGRAPELPPGLVKSTEDLPTMKYRRAVRVLVKYSRTDYFLDAKYHHRGLEYEKMKKYEKFLNKSRKRGEVRIQMIFIPVPFKQLIPSLLEGRGDIIAAGMTVTPQRQAKVAFTEPYIRDIKEQIVFHKSVSDFRQLEDLAGRSIYVLQGSSYGQHLKTLNLRFKKERRKPINIVDADQHLSTEDILELVNAGVFTMTVADSHIFTLWKEVLPDIRSHDEIVVNSDGRIAWAVRKNNPKLLASLNEFVKTIRQGTLTGNLLFNRYYKKTKWVRNPLTETDGKKLERIIDLFVKYSYKYGFDWIAIAAQAYQESTFDQSKRSPAGAVGIMQVRPQTAADPNVGIRHIEKLENNIHAGVKYMNFIRANYFSEPDISRADQMNFSYAAYNAGPNRIARLRIKAQKQGLDHNQWFQNVELVARKDIGTETVRYVRNIHKYYLAYRLIVSRDENWRKAFQKQKLESMH